MEEVGRVIPQSASLRLLRQVLVFHNDPHLIGEEIQDVRQRILASPHHRALPYCVHQLRQRPFPGVAGRKSLRLEHAVRRLGARGVLAEEPTPVLLKRLKLLRRLQAVKLSPDEAWALLERVKTHTSSADDREQLAHLIRVTLEGTAQLRAEPDPDVQTSPVSEQLLPTPKAKRTRQLAKATRRRHRRERWR